MTMEVPKSSRFYMVYEQLMGKAKTMPPMLVFLRALSDRKSVE